METAVITLLFVHLFLFFGVFLTEIGYYVYRLGTCNLYGDLATEDKEGYKLYLNPLLNKLDDEMFYGVQNDSDDYIFTVFIIFVATVVSLVSTVIIAFLYFEVFPLFVLLIISLLLTAFALFNRNVIKLKRKTEKEE